MDELNKVVLVTLKIDAKELIKEIKLAEVAMEDFVQDILNLRAASEGSFDSIKAKIKESLENEMTKATGEIRKAGEAIKELKKHIDMLDAGKVMGSEGRFKDLDMDQSIDEMEKFKQKLVQAKTEVDKLNEKMKMLPTAIKNAKEATSQLPEQVKTTVDKYEEMRKKVDAVKREMLKLVETGRNIKDVADSMREVGEFDSSNITKAERELRTAFDFGHRIKQVTDEMHKMSGVAKILTSTLRGFGVSASSTSTIMGMLGSVFKGFGGSASLASSSASSASTAVSASGAAAASAGVPWAALAGMLAGKVAGAFKAVMNSIKRVARIVTGILISRAIMGMVQAFRDAVEEALKLNRAFIDVATSVRQLQRAGLDTTIGEWAELVDQLEDRFTQFSKAQIADAVKQIAILGRQSGASEDEIRTLSEQVLHLATVMGVDAVTAANAFATAVESGYARGLKEVIGVIDKTTLAQQAVTWGWAKSAEEVDGHMRMLVLLELAQRKQLETMGDVEVVQDSLSGKYNEVTQDIIDQKAAIGEDLLPILVLLKEGFLDILESIESVIGGIKRFIATIYGLIAVIKTNLTPALDAAGASIKLFFSNIGTTILNKILPPLGTLISYLNVLKSFGLLPEIKLIDEENLWTATQELDSFKNAYEEVMSILDPETFENLDEEIGKVGQSFENAIEPMEEFGELLEEIGDVIEDTQDKILEEQDDFVHEFAQAEDKLRLELKQAEEKHLQEQQQAYEKYLQEQLQATEKYALETKQAYEDYQLSISQLEEEYTKEVEEINADYRKRELDEETKFQEELRQLREEFLFDLEDALRERDAKQVLRLIRQYNLEREQMMRERALKEEERERELQADLEAAEKEKEAKLQQMQEEFELEQQQRQENFELAQQQRAADYALAAKQREQDYELARKQRVQDFALQQQQRLEDHQRRLEEIRQQGIERAEELLNAFEKEYQISDEWATKVAEALGLQFGPGGAVEAIHNYLLQLIHSMETATAQSLNNVLSMIEQTAAAITAINNQLSGAYGGSASNPHTQDVINPGIRGFAEGGTMIATRPTTVTFGEAGIEAATFLPLGRKGQDVNKVFGEIPMGASQDQFVRLMVDLSPDLEVRIVEKSIGTVADVMEGRIL